jgi:ethanolamine utilization protein EutS
MAHSYAYHTKSKREVIMDLQKIDRDEHGRLRIIQETVPGKQITLAHIIASPDPVVYQKLGLDPAVDYSKSAIGIITVTPSETAIIAGDIATKASNIELGFIDRFSGSLIVSGSVSDVTSAVESVVSYVREKLGFAVCEITRT